MKNYDKALEMAKEFLEDTYLKYKDMYCTGIFKTFYFDNGEEIDLGYCVDNEGIGVSCRLVIDGDTMETFTTNDITIEDIAECIIRLS